MSAADILKTISDGLSSDAKVTHVFGDAVTAGDRTIVPVAKINRAFGGGGGGSTDREKADGGGGGYMKAVPLGVFEISPEGTRFISCWDVRQRAAALAFGAGIGYLFGLCRKRPQAHK